jgi:hypothetical protein
VNPGGGQVAVDDSFFAAGLPVGVVIDHNTFAPCPDAIACYGVEISAPATVTNNDINGQRQAGIKVQAGRGAGLLQGKKILIAGNKIRNTFNTGGGDPAGSAIILNPNVRNVAIIGNFGWDDQAIKTQTWGLAIDATNTNILAEGNNFLDNLSGGILNNASGVASVQVRNNLPDTADKSRP